MHTIRPFVAGVVFAALLLMPVPASGGDAGIAVAANFTAPAKEIAALYQSRSGRSLDLSFGASGQFYTQISQGAPFDAFLCADDERTRKAMQEGLAVPGSEFTYAVGKLVLWSADTALVDPDGAVLREGNFAKLAVANPKTAPYGVAAMETLKALGLGDALQAKIVQGANISQTYQFVLTRNAELGFVAYSQVIDQKTGSRWMVPEKLHAPIVQNAVLLKRGTNNLAAKVFLTFLKGAEAAAVIRRYGYALPGDK